MCHVIYRRCTLWRHGDSKTSCFCPALCARIVFCINVGVIAFELCDLWRYSLTTFMQNTMRARSVGQISMEGGVDVNKGHMVYWKAKHFLPMQPPLICCCNLIRYRRRRPQPHQPAPIHERIQTETGGSWLVTSGDRWRIRYGRIHQPYRAPVGRNDSWGEVQDHLIRFSFFHFYSKQ